jgi:hypothetical protein
MKHPERVALFAMLAAMAVAPLAPGHGTLKGNRSETSEAQLQSLSSRSPAWRANRDDTDNVIVPPSAGARAMRSESSGDMSRDPSTDTSAPRTSPTSEVPSQVETPATRGLTDIDRSSDQRR